MAENSTKVFLQIAVPVPVNSSFIYTGTADLINKSLVGKRVLISFSRRKLAGYVLRIVPPEDIKGLKDIIGVIDNYPIFPPSMVTFFEWLSDYYHYPIGLVIKSVLPTGLITKCPTGKNIGSKGLLERVGRSKSVFLNATREMPIQRDARNLKGAPKNENEFLNLFRENNNIPLSEITRNFSNGPYLVEKWVKKGYLKKSIRAHFKNTSDKTIFIPTIPPPLNSKQKQITEKITEKLNENKYFTYLLYGVTGSGKTEVYYHAIKAAAKLGKKSILLVPEIALTVSLASLFESRFKERVSILHSALTQAQRYHQWCKIARGKIDLVIGTRSALFAPLSDLGLIVVDEEHDTSYKQEEKFRYHARDSAIVRAKLVNAVVVLGSGTPSIQSYQNTVNGKYGLLSIHERIYKRQLPDIKIIDMRHFENNKGNNAIISPPLKEAIGENLKKDKQAILFLNRRGFNVMYLCRLCGEAIKCQNCDVSLTYHKDENSLVCHFCGYRINPPTLCPSCKGKNLKPYGFGTERVVEIVKEMFPVARTERMDRDTTRHKGSLQKILKRFLHHEIDILVGTQMITKGHDFPDVTLVGVISADLSLNWPDFRAGEITFQLISQVAGRTGRGDFPGRVIIQTYNPSHYTINAAKHHDYKRFFSRETILRKDLNYPPFSSIASLKITGNRRENTEKTARQTVIVANQIIKKLPGAEKNIVILGPVESPVAKLKGKYRQQILVKSNNHRYLNLLLREINMTLPKTLSAGSSRFVIDVDPYQMI